MDYAFREITPDDDEKIVSIIRKNLEAYSLNIPGTAYFDEGLDHLSTCYGKDDEGYYVLECDGQVVGGIGFAKFPFMDDTAELQKIYLDDPVKGKGLGYRMIKFVENKMKEAGFKRSYLETHDNLQAAIHIYEKSGYTEIDKPAETGHSSMNRFFIKDL